MKIKHISQFNSGFTSKTFGYLPNGEVINVFELTNKKGLQLQIIGYGAAISALKIPSSKKKIIDVVLGFDNIEDYINSNVGARESINNTSMLNYEPEDRVENQRPENTAACLSHSKS